MRAIRYGALVLIALAIWGIGRNPLCVQLDMELILLWALYFILI